MAENKKSFIAYVDWKETFDVLPDDLAGKLIKHLFAYVNDENPSTQDVLINAVFANIKHTLKRDLRKYETIRKKRADAGRVSGERRKQKGTKRTSVQCVEQTRTKRTDSVNVNDIKNTYIKWIDNSNNDNYKRLVSFILGENPTGEELTEVLKLKNQITEDKFMKLLELSNKIKVKITDKLIAIENHQRTSAPNKKQKDLMMTLVNWMNYNNKQWKK